MKETFLSSKEIGVVVSVYNRERYIADALESLLNQSLSHDRYDIVVIDDGSTDNTRTVIEQYSAGDNISILHNEVNRGLVYSLNRVIKQLRTKYIMRFDADDIADKNLLSELVMNIGAHSFCHPYMRVFYNDNTERTYEYRVSKTASFFASGVLFDANLFLELCYDDVFWEEFDFYIQILRKEATYIILPRALLLHRIHENNMTGDKSSFVAGYQELENKWGRKTLLEYGLSYDELYSAYAYYFTKCHEKRGN
jgi:glycosyltransferase involved in cell wall biosynthesis